MITTITAFKGLDGNTHATYEQAANASLLYALENALCASFDGEGNGKVGVNSGAFVGAFAANPELLAWLNASVKAAQAGYGAPTEQTASEYSYAMAQ